MKPSETVALITAGLLGPSACVVLLGAGDEPYTSFRASDAVVQIGVASALIVLWALWAGFIATLAARRKLHPAWLSALVLCALAIFFLYQSPDGYISDLVKFEVVRRS